MKIERICVRRLKSFLDYSNVAVELCASLDEGDDVDKVYGDLLEKANILIERTRAIEQGNELARKIEAERRSIKEHLIYLEDLMKKLEEQKQLLLESIVEAQTLLSKALSIKSKIAKFIEYLRGRA